MDRGFFALSHRDLQWLRRQDAVVGKMDKVMYNITADDVEAAVIYLNRIYKCRVRRSFATRLLLQYSIYKTKIKRQQLVSILQEFLLARHAMYIALAPQKGCRS